MLMFGRALLGLVVAIGTTVMLVAAPAVAVPAASINPIAGDPGTVITDIEPHRQANRDATNHPVTPPPFSSRQIWAAPLLSYDGD
jgi:hypothetical protein